MAGELMAELGYERSVGAGARFADAEGLGWFRDFAMDWLGGFAK